MPKIQWIIGPIVDNNVATIKDFESTAKKDSSIESTLPSRFWSVGLVFAAFSGLLAVTSKK